MSIFGDIVAGTGAAATAYLAGSAAKKATNQAVKGINQGVGEQRDNLDFVKGSYAPYTGTGGNALSVIGNLSGANGRQSQLDAFGNYIESPEVAFTRDQGIKAIDRSATSRGGLYSGRTLSSLDEFGQGVAMQGYGSYYDRLARLAGMGLDATGDVARTATGTANNISDLLVGKGLTKAAGTIGKTNAYIGGVQGVGDSLASLGEDGFNPLAKLGASSYGR